MVQSREVNQEVLEEKAADLITLLSQEKHEEARKVISHALAIELTADKIERIWEYLIEITGPIKKQLGFLVISTINQYRLSGY